MSRSSPQLTNPAVHFFEWRGGRLVYWDKEAQKEVVIKLPFQFLVLDQLHTITGYSDQDQSGYWSNETRSTKDDFNVRTKRGSKYFGPYKNAQGIVQVPTGARYTKSVYIAYKEENDWAIGNLKVTGAALNAWIDLSGQYNLENGKVVLTGSTEGKKGATVYQIPTFEYTNSTEAEDNMAIQLDKVLQTYLTQYLTVKDDHDDSVIVDELDDSETKATPEQIADFEKRKAEKLSKEPVKADDYPDDDVETYKRQTEEDYQFTDADIPPEFR